MAPETPAEPAGDRLVGGIGRLRDPDDDVKAAVEAVRAELEQKTGRKYKSLEVLSYKHQLVAGSNFFPKVKATTTDGVELIYHLRIYRDLSKKYELTDMQKDKKLEDQIAYF